MLFAASFPSLPPLKPLLYYSTLYYSTQTSILPFLKPLHCSTQNHQTSTLLLYSNIYTTHPSISLLYQTNNNTLTSSNLNTCCFSNLHGGSISANVHSLWWTQKKSTDSFVGGRVCREYQLFFECASCDLPWIEISPPPFPNSLSNCLFCINS